MTRPIGGKMYSVQGGSVAVAGDLEKYIRAVNTEVRNGNRNADVVNTAGTVVYSGEKVNLDAALRYS